MYTSYIEKEKYIKSMRAMKNDNAQIMQMINNKNSKRDIIKSKILYAVLHFDIKMMLNGLKDVKTWLLLKKTHKNELLQLKEISRNEDYFSDERIAVYSCIFGKYDHLEEPLVYPDNVDYYIVTDSEIKPDSSWKKIDICKWEKEIEKLSNAEKNRFFKMHPDLLFPHYNYSVYVDGNIKIITDITECINNIGRYGLALHGHGRRRCVYDELTICGIYGKDTKRNLDEMRKKYEKENMPVNYGLVENGIIARKHNDEAVKEIMSKWWQYYMKFCRRDQLSLPLVLFESGIRIEEIATLGTSTGSDYAFRTIRHGRGN